MIVFVHANNTVEDVLVNGKRSNHQFGGLTETIVQFSKMHPNEILVWCEKKYIDSLDYGYIEKLFSFSKNTICSYSYDEDPFVGWIGYVELLPFIKIDKKSKFPTWIMSSDIGVIHAGLLCQVITNVPIHDNFEYYINSLSKLMMPLGAFCYSDPNLLKESPVQKVKNQPFSSLLIFDFVSRHYKKRWVFVLLFCAIYFENKWPILAFFKALFRRHLSIGNLTLDQNFKQKSNSKKINTTIDVIIPTIGRKKYLYNVLKLLSNQSVVPHKVIIVEQNPQKGTSSDLDYLVSEKWPFIIDHLFTHTTGACNARNLALDRVESEWLFLADDDIVFDSDFLEKSIKRCISYNLDVVTLSCVLQGEKTHSHIIKQWHTFGSGCSVLRSKTVDTIRFDMRFEFGFGEDADFGLQIRSSGKDVIYLPSPEIIHLKAPIGGFRTNFAFPWENDVKGVKPSPTIMLFKMLHHTVQQLLGYKLILFFNYYRKQTVRNPFKYYRVFKDQWNRSVHWAKIIKKK